MNTSTIPACLRKYIGIRAGCDPEPSPSNQNPLSGLYIDDLEGVDVVTASRILPDGNTAANGEELLNRLIEKGIGLAWDDIHGKMSTLYQIKSVLGLRNDGVFTNSFLMPVTGFKGLIIEKQTSSNCGRCTGEYRAIDMQRIYVRAVRLKGKATVTLPLYLVDGNIVRQFNVDLVAGQIQEVLIDHLAQNRTVSIYWDAGTAEADLGSVTKSHYNCNTCKNPYGVKKPDVLVTGFDYTTSAYTQYCYGISVDYQVRCDESIIQCALSDKMKYLYLYRAGMEFALAWKYSSRVNEATLYNNTNPQELYEHFARQYDERYRTFMITAESSLRDLDGSCIECKGNRYTYSL